MFIPSNWHFSRYWHPGDSTHSGFDAIRAFRFPFLFRCRPSDQGVRYSQNPLRYQFTFRFLSHMLESSWRPTKRTCMKRRIAESFFSSLASLQGKPSCATHSCFEGAGSPKRAALSNQKMPFFKTLIYAPRAPRTPALSNNRTGWHPGGRSSCGNFRFGFGALL